MSETFSCGFVRAMLMKTSQNCHSSILQTAAFQKLNENFTTNMTKGNFKVQYGKMRDKLKKKVWDQSEKNDYMNYFSYDAWIGLSEDERFSHTVKGCPACEENLNHKSINEKFPLHKATPLRDISNHTTPKQLKQTKQMESTPQNLKTPNQPTRKEKEDAMKVFNETSDAWEKTHSTPFTQVIASVKKSNLVHRKTSNEKLKEKRILQTQIKKHEESLWTEEDKDLDVVLATRQSFNSRKKQRKQLFFSSPSKAKRNKTNKRHVQHHSKLNFQKEALLEHVKSLGNNSRLNLTGLARQFGVPNKGNRGNIIVKEFLKDNGVENQCLEPKKQRERRSKNKMPGSTGVSVASFRTEEKLKEALRRTLENGKYSLGHLIKPKIFKKRKMGMNGPVIEEFRVSGRKIPLIGIRRKMNREHSKKKVLREGNIQRYLSVWSDHASVMNHGHLMITVKPLFTTETFHSSKEMKEKFDVDMDVQEFVETPQLYILACSSDSVAEKICYTECRVDDLIDLSIETKVDSSIVKDTLRFFHADHPEISYECGTSKGGTYPCICPTKKENFVDLDTCYKNRMLSIEERRNKMMVGQAWKRGGANPFETLNKEGLNLEIALRNVDTLRKDGKEPTKEQLKLSLKHEMKGIHRVPTLLGSGNEERTLEELNLDKYEISPSEPLHDVKGEIANTLEALPDVLSESQKTILEETLELAFGDKDKKRGCDYRAATILVYLYLSQNAAKPCSPEVTELLYTLVSLSKLAYESAELRTPKSVLMMYNVTFRYAMAKMDLFGMKWSSSKMSNTKFYGLYYHSIVSHFADIHRIIALSSLHAEEEERTFSSVNSISTATSSRALEHVRDNSIIRMQAEKNLAMKEGKKYKSNSNVSKYGKELKPRSRSRFCLSEIDDSLWQSHLERIADFLLVGEDRWWHREGDTIIFHDGEEDQESLEEGPTLMEFTKFNFKSSAEKRSECWDLCLSNSVPLPANKIYASDGWLRKETCVDIGSEETIQDEYETDDVADEEERETVIEEVIPTEIPCAKKPRLIRFKHNLTNSIYGVIGPHILLKDLDKNVVDFEKNKYASALNYCRRMLPKLILEVRKIRENQQNVLKVWENEFFLANEKGPSLSDIDAAVDASSAYELIGNADECI